MISINVQPKSDDIILFVGGGPVAERRLGLCLSEPARCIVISPQITESMRGWHDEEKFEWIQEAFGEHHEHLIEESMLLFICTDNEIVNDHLETLGRKHKVLLNRSDHVRHCDFTVPSTLDIGDMHIAISANNAGPRINRLMRIDMTKRYGRLQFAIPRLTIFREEVKLLIPHVEERQQFWRTHLGEREFQAILNGEWPLIEEKLHDAISGLRSQS